jgi:hypothetical protein
MHEVAVISDRWKICTLRDLLRVLFFLDRVTGDANIVIVPECELNGFLQRYVARRRRVIVCFLGRCNANRKGRSC